MRPDPGQSQYNERKKNMKAISDVGSSGDPLVSFFEGDDTPG